MKSKVCVFGSFNLDIVAGISRFPNPGESLIANNSMMGAGGKGANQATAALRAGARVHYIGKIGKDDFGQFARRHLDSIGFDAVTIFYSNDRPTGNALIFVAGEDAENMIAVDPGANLAMTTAEVMRCQPTIESADILLIQLENNLSAIQKVVEIARQSNTYIILNPAPFQKIPEALLKQIDLLTPNSTEAMLLTGVKVTNIESAKQAANALHKKGVKKLVITLGTKGALLSDEQGQALIPLFPAQPKDTTGAGDAFNGALAAQMAKGISLRDAALFAAASAAVCVERLGASASMPSYSDALKKLKDNPNLKLIAC